MKKLNSKKEVKEYFAGDKIECLLCGKFFKSLGKHISLQHSVTVDEYKTMFNIPWGRGLVADETALKMASALIARIESGDESIMNIKDVADIGQHAPKRPTRDYEKKRMQKIQAMITEQHKKDSYNKALKILDKAEEMNCPACCVCSLPGMPSMSSLQSALKNKDYPDVKRRYEDLKRNISRGIELKLDQSRSETKNQIFELKKAGFSSRKIAKTLLLGPTTVKRALRNEGLFAVQPPATGKP